MSFLTQEVSTKDGVIVILAVAYLAVSIIAIDAILIIKEFIG